MTIDVGAVVATSAQLTVLLAAMGGAVIWLKIWIRRQVVEPVQRVETQVHSNSGDSLSDAVDRTEAKVASIETKIDALVRRFEDHLIIGHRGAE